SVSAKLRPDPDSNAVKSMQTGSSGSYPLLHRKYNLAKTLEKIDPSSDSWTIELSYEEIADYYPAMIFPSQQRVAFAAELWDASENATDPQGFIQGLPVAQTLTRLSIPSAVTRIPVTIRASF